METREFVVSKVFLFYGECGSTGPNPIRKEFPVIGGNRKEQAYAIMGMMMSQKAWTYCAQWTCEYLGSNWENGTKWMFFFHQHDEHQGSYEFWPILVGDWTEEEIEKVKNFEFEDTIVVTSKDGREIQLTSLERMEEAAALMKVLGVIPVEPYPGE
jgi:hypothetical protein